MKINKLFDKNGCISLEALTAFIASDISDEDAYRINEHLKECEFCNDAIEGLKLSNQPVKSISTIKNDIKLKYGNAQNLERSNNGRKFLWYSSIAASIAIVIGVFLFTNPLEPNQISEDILIKNENSDVIIHPPKPLFSNNISSSDNVMSSNNISNMKKLFAQNNIMADNNNLKDKIFEFPDEMPEFPNGITALDKVISMKIKEVEVTYKLQSCNKILVEFIIDENGKVTNPVVTNRNKTKLDKIAIEVIKNLPTWKPGRQSGQAVKVLCTLPVKFDSC